MRPRRRSAFPLTKRGSPKSAPISPSHSSLPRWSAKRNCRTMPSPRRSSKPEADFDSGWVSAGDIAEAVAKGRVSAVRIVEDALTRITARDPVLNSFTDVLADRARARARAVDAARGKRKKLGPLAGLPFAVKNLFDVKGLPTRAGSKINRELAPAAHDQPLIERLEAAGAVLIGALNMGEYA